jgi:hypothetical protein
LKARRALLGWLACASAACSGGIAAASTVPGEVVTGTVTAINGNVVTIQGKTYPIGTNSAAYAVAANFKPGQLVDVQLNGPARSSTSQAINIVLHQGE